MDRNLTDGDIAAIEGAIRRAIAAEAPVAKRAETLRNVYTAEQFASEVLCGNRHPNWVGDQCKAKKIKWVARRPWLIPQSEALRFIAPQK